MRLQSWIVLDPLASQDEQSDGPKSRAARFLMETLLAATSVIAGVRRMRLRPMNRSLFRFRISTLLIVVTIVAAGLAFYVHRILRQPNYKLMHVGSSLAMAPTITREILAVDIHAYRLAKPARWDVVVLHPQEQPTGAYVAEILRVIGLPGETVSISDGKIVVDGQPVTQPQHIQSVRFSAAASDTNSELHPYTVPEGHYYLLGDNPAEAKDSRTLGGIPEAEIRGRVSGSR